MDAKLFGFIIVTGVCLFYLILTFRRKCRYRRLSEKMSGTYRTKGFFNLGEVEARYKGRNFRFVTKKHVGPSGSTFFSTCTMTTAYTGKTITIKKGFFKNFPNWQYAAISFMRSGPGFQAVLQSKTRKASECPDEQPWLRAVLSDLGMPHREIAKLLRAPLWGSALLTARTGTVSFEVNGVLPNEERTNRICELLFVFLTRLEEIKP